MSIVSIPPFELPRAHSSQGAPSYTAGTFNANSDKIALIFQPTKAGLIRRIGFRVGSVTTPTSVLARVETVSGRFPTGTLWAANTEGTIASGSIVANAFPMATLTADANVDEDDLVAIVFSGNGVDTPNFQYFGGAGANNWEIVNQFPFFAEFPGASWAALTIHAHIAVEYSDGSYAYIPSVFPWLGSGSIPTNSHAISTSTTPDEIALKFRLPAPARIGGFWLLIDLDNACDIILYAANGSTVLASKSLTSDYRRSTGEGSPVWVNFTTKPTLAANTVYYLAVKPTTASNIVLRSFDVASNAVLGQLSSGIDFYWSQRTDAGAWADTNTRRPIMGLMIDGISDGKAGRAQALVGV